MVVQALDRSGCALTDLVGDGEDALDFLVGADEDDRLALALEPGHHLVQQVETGVIRVHRDGNASLVDLHARSVDAIVHLAARDGVRPSIEAPMAYAYNPTVRGAKSEDTVLVTDDGVEVLTRTGGWPARTVSSCASAFTIDRHAVRRLDVG